MSGIEGQAGLLNRLASHPSNSIRLRNVTVRYGRTVALRDLTLDIPCGGLTAILGPNGAGKSTLLRAILGWHEPADGEVFLGDAHPRQALGRLSYLPQRQAIDWDFPITVREVVAQGRYPALRFFQKFSAGDHHRVDRALEELALTALARRPLRMLSGGQQQRVFLARALAQGADIFLLDEPFAGLDLFATGELTHILRAWEAQGRTVLAAVHDIPLARRVFSRGILLDGALVAAGDIDTVLSPENIQRAFRGGHCVHENPLGFLAENTGPSAPQGARPGPT
jgi:ABC-type Mn2+/Zn2+ transport system ATPase subunit